MKMGKKKNGSPKNIERSDKKYYPCEIKRA
jgi:hypothetical protein